MCCCVGLIGLDGWLGCNGLDKSFLARDGMDGMVSMDGISCCKWMDGIRYVPLL
jgi:hypothetical protein